MPKRNDLEQKALHFVVNTGAGTRRKQPRRLKSSDKAGRKGTYPQRKRTSRWKMDLQTFPQEASSVY